jgi:hypothetical protein
MVADNIFDEMISIIAVPIAILLDEQENGGKVSILLDNKENPSIGNTQEVTNERFDKHDFRGCYPADER